MGNLNKQIDELQKSGLGGGQPAGSILKFTPEQEIKKQQLQIARDQLVLLKQIAGGDHAGASEKVFGPGNNVTNFTVNDLANHENMAKSNIESLSAQIDDLKGVGDDSRFREDFELLKNRLAEEENKKFLARAELNKRA